MTQPSYKNEITEAFVQTHSTQEGTGTNSVHTFKNGTELKRRDVFKRVFELHTAAREGDRKASDVLAEMAGIDSGARTSYLRLNDLVVVPVTETKPRNPELTPGSKKSKPTKVATAANAEDNKENDDMTQTAPPVEETIEDAAPAEGTPDTSGVADAIGLGSDKPKKGKKEKAAKAPKEPKVKAAKEPKAPKELTDEERAQLDEYKAKYGTKKDGSEVDLETFTKIGTRSRVSLESRARMALAAKKRWQDKEKREALLATMKRKAPAAESTEPTAPAESE